MFELLSWGCCAVFLWWVFTAAALRAWPADTLFALAALIVALNCFVPFMAWNTVICSGIHLREDARQRWARKMEAAEVASGG